MDYFNYKKHPVWVWIITSFFILLAFSYIFSEFINRYPLLFLIPLFIMPVLWAIYTSLINRKLFKSSWLISWLSLFAYPVWYFLFFFMPLHTPVSAIDTRNSVIIFLLISWLWLFFLDDDNYIKEPSWIELIKNEWYIFFPLAMLILIPLSFYLFSR